MSITKESELSGMQKAGRAVARTLREMINYAQPGMSTKALDDYGAKILSDFGARSEAGKKGFRVVKNLCGHGVGRSLHEQPDEILNYKNRFDQRRFKKNMVVAVETFITTLSSYATELEDGWTMVGNKCGYMAQQEHTIVVTDGQPIILTESNGILN